MQQTLAQAGNRYLSDRVLTASPVELTAMLFDAACASSRGAIKAMDESDFSTARLRLLKAQDLVSELRSALDRSVGSMATNLDSLYAWCLSLLVQANVRRDAQLVTDALAVLDPLRTAWRQAHLGAAATSESSTRAAESYAA